MEFNIQDDGQMSFGLNEKDQTGLKIIEGGKGRGEYGFHVDKFDYIDTEEMSVPELFGYGKYSELRIVTFSCDIRFLDELAKHYERTELLVGFENTLGKDEIALFAYQKRAADVIKGSREICRLAEAGKFHAYVTRDPWTHSKLYLLRSDNGETRVILGSANASTGAWNGSHIENVQYCDMPEYYQRQIKGFDTLKDIGTDEIEIEAKPKKTDTIIDEIPALKAVIKTRNAVLINPSRDDTMYEMIPKKDLKLLKEVIKTGDIRFKRDESGKTIISYDQVKKLKAAAKKLSVTADERIKNPALLVDPEYGKAYMGNEEINLEVDSSSLRTTVDAFLSYMNGFDNLTRDSEWQKKQYFKLMSYMFVSPFISYLKHVAIENQISNPRFFPMYCYIHGPLDAGKSAFAACCRYMMTGIKIKVIPWGELKIGKDSTYAQTLHCMQREPDATPIIIDELPAGSLTTKGNGEFFKRDRDIYMENRDSGVMILLSNASASLNAEIVKRILFLPVTGRFDPDSTIDRAKATAVSSKRIGTEIYREYLKRIFQRLSKFIDDIQTGKETAPDIFQVSSSIVHDILIENGCPEEEWMQPFTLKDVMGTTALDKRSKDVLSDLWKVEPDKFSIYRKRNVLEVTLKNSSGYADSKLITLLHNEIPATAHCKEFDGKIILDLDYAEEWLGIRFKRKWKGFRRR